MLSKKNLRLRLLPRRSTTTTRRRRRRLVSQYMVSRHRQRRCQKASAVAQLVHSTPLAGTKIKSPAQRRAREKEMEKKKRTKTLPYNLFLSLSLPSSVRFLFLFPCLFSTLFWTFSIGPRYFASDHISKPTAPMNSNQNKVTGRLKNKNHRHGHSCESFDRGIVQITSRLLIAYTCRTYNVPDRTVTGHELLLPTYE